MDRIKTIAHSSIFEWFQKPSAIRFVGQHDRTYISWIEHSGKIQIRYYDHDLKEFSDIYTVDDLYEDYGHYAQDDHNCPSLLILPNGKILIFYFVHDTLNNLFMRTSENVEDISKWGDRRNISDITFLKDYQYGYPQAKRLSNGNILLFYRCGVCRNSIEKYKISEDNGETWSSSIKLIDFGKVGIYAFVYLKNDIIHIAWNESFYDYPYRKNVYYIQSDDAGKNWKQRNGNLVRIPARRNNSNLIFDSGNESTYVWDIVANDYNEPFIVFAHKADPNHEFCFSKWENSSWRTSTITNSAQLYGFNHFYSGGIVIDPNDVYKVYLSKKHYKLEIESWISDDEGKKWKLLEQITKDSSVDNFRLQVISNYRNDMKIVWASGIYEGHINGEWIGFDKVDIKSEITKDFTSEKEKKSPNEIETINIVFASDDNYAPHTGVALCSIFENRTSKNPINIYILDGGISENNKNKLRVLEEKYKFKINFIDINNSLFDDLYTQRHLTKVAFYRLLIPRLLPEIKKILYLDCDLVVLGDVFELYKIDVTNYLCAAVDEIAIRKDKISTCDKFERIEFSDTNKYFNSGVMLINLDNWRREKISEKTLKFIKDNQKKYKEHYFTTHDQDALNIILKDRWLNIPFKYNYMDLIMLRSSNNYKKFKNDFLIIHYTGAYKPYNYLSLNRFNKYYFYYLGKTPWKDDIKVTNKNFKNMLIKIKRMSAYYIIRKSYLLPKSILNIILKIKRKLKIKFY